MLNFFKQQKVICQLTRELKDTRAQLEKLRQQNESMREGMRRCVTCDYRVEVLEKRKKSSEFSQDS